MFFQRVFPVVVAFASGVLAQSNMAQCDSGFDWNKNSLGQDPCTVGSLMDASCRSLAVYTYPAINATEYYLPPRANHSGDLMCDCNTVMYSLYMACSSCQGGEVYSWSRWIAQCNTSVYISQYPVDIAQQTAVPHWAYDDVTMLPNMTFDNAVAMNIGRNPEALPKQISTISGATGTNTPTNASTSKSGRKVGAIVGGVVGAIAGLAIFAIAAFFCMRYRRRQPARQLEEPQVDLAYGWPTTPTYGVSTTSVPLITYDPINPSTFPSSLPPAPVAYTTSPFNDTRGKYSGVPEI